MSHNTHNLETNEAWNAIAAIDLEPIMVKIIFPEDEEGWTLEKTELAVKEYRKFLYLVKTNPDIKIVPTKFVDKVWHTHILDTEKYFDDCQNLFGAYLHHFPYIGMRGEEDRQLLSDQFEITKRVYLETFGYPIETLTDESMCNCTSCNGQCNSASLKLLETRPRLKDYQMELTI